MPLQRLLIQINRMEMPKKIFEEKPKNLWKRNNGIYQVSQLTLSLLIIISSNFKY